MKKNSVFEENKALVNRNDPEIKAYFSQDQKLQELISNFVSTIPEKGTHNKR
jgi:hypothetical protein